MKWSHVAAVLTGLLIAAAFGWTGETQPSRLSAMSDLEALGAVVLVFGLFLLAWHHFWSVDWYGKKKIYYVDWHEEKPE